MAAAEVYLDALYTLVTHFVGMMARINREGWQMERQALEEGIDISADVEREMEINIRDIV